MFAGGQPTPAALADSWRLAFNRQLFGQFLALIAGYRQRLTTVSNGRSQDTCPQVGSCPRKSNSSTKSLLDESRMFVALVAYSVEMLRTPRTSRFPNVSEGGGIRNQRNLEWQNLAQQKCAKLCRGILMSEAIAGIQKPPGNNNEYSQFMLNPVPQSGNFESNFAVALQKCTCGAHQISHVPNPPPPSGSGSRSDFSGCIGIVVPMVLADEDSVSAVCREG